MLKEAVKSLLGPKRLGRIDFHLRFIRTGWINPPFNGQTGKRDIVVDILNTLTFSSVVETGAFRGSTTRELARVSHLPVFTTEADPRSWQFSALRLDQLAGVSIAALDSREFLRTLASDGTLPAGATLFYLDAHWEQDLPLWEELLLIRGHFPRSVIVIDDFQVPDDDRYRFDDYGPGQSLTLRDLEDQVEATLDAPFTCFFPTLPGSRENGGQRGTLVCSLDETMIEGLRQITRLREWHRTAPPPDSRP